VILSRFQREDPEAVEIETQEDAQAQAKAVVDHGRIKRKAQRVVNFWFWGGTILFGIPFRKGKKDRAPVLNEAMADYMIETGKEIDVPPGLNAIGAFVSDFEEMLWLNVGENPKDGAVKKFLLRRLPFIRWAFKKRVTGKRGGRSAAAPENTTATQTEGE
jgi:hypothetical protein